MYWPVVLGGGIGVTGLGVLLAWACEYRPRLPAVRVSFPRWLLPFCPLIVSGGVWAHWWVVHPGHPESHYALVAASVYGFGLVGCSWAGRLYPSSQLSPWDNKQDIMALLLVASLFEGIALGIWQWWR